MYKILLLLLMYIAVINAFENLEIIDIPGDTNNIKYKNASYGYWNSWGRFVHY